MLNAILFPDVLFIGFTGRGVQIDRAHRAFENDFMKAVDRVFFGLSDIREGMNFPIIDAFHSPFSQILESYRLGGWKET